MSKACSLSSAGLIICLAFLGSFNNAFASPGEGDGETQKNPNGAQKLESKAQSEKFTQRTLSDGSFEITVTYSDDVKRTFNFKSGFSDGVKVLTQPDSIVLTTVENETSKWQKIDGNLYEEDGVKNRLEISVSQNGVYTFRNLSTGYAVFRDLSGNVEEVTTDFDGSVRTERNGDLVGFKYGEHEIEIVSDQEFKHLNQNRVYTKNPDGTWKSSLILTNKPTAQATAFESEVMGSQHLTPTAKVRVLANWKTFDGNSSYNSSQKQEFKDAILSMLKAKQGAPYTDKDRANYADQLLWHVCNLTRNAQGKNNSCNVTVLRGLLLAENPELVAKIVAEVVNTGEFKTQDGSTIKLPPSYTLPISGTPEASFPPSPGKRSALGKLWDVTAINVYYQRQTKDEFGSSVTKGSLTYREVKSTGSGDTGNRLVRTYSNGTMHCLGRNVNGRYYYLDQPRMFASRIADLHFEMTGMKLSGKFLIHANRGVGNSSTFNRLVGNKIDDQVELENILAKRDFPVIIQGNTGILKQRYQQQQAINKGQSPNSIGLGGGGEHVWLVTAYDAQTKTVTVDNSWYPAYDVLCKSDAKASGINLKKHVAITVDDLYKCMQRSSSGGRGGSLVYLIFKQ